MPPDDHPHRQSHFARVRRVKRFLRLMPRRARLHKYPVIGRFAALARRRAHLWSFKSSHVRPAIYAGSILTMLPLMGIQIPLSFVFALALRCNFMVMAGLQLITNPFTAAPAYYATYLLGKAVIDVSGFGAGVELETTGLVPADPHHPAPEPVGFSEDEPPQRLLWTRGFGTAINALLIGGAISGAALGALLDALWMLGVRRTRAHRRKVLARRTASGSTDNPADPV